MSVDIAQISKIEGLPETKTFENSSHILNSLLLSSLITV